MTRKKTLDRSNIVLRVLSGLVLIVLAGYMIWILARGVGIHPSNLGEELGVLGAFFYRVIHSLAGSGGWLVPILVGAAGVHLSIPRFSPNRRQVIAFIGIAVLFLGMKHLNIEPEKSFAYGRDGIGGGLIGALVSFLFVKLFGATGTRFIMLAGMVLFLYYGSNGKLLVWLALLAQNARPALARFVQQFKHFVFVDDQSGLPENKDEGLLARMRQRLPKREHAPQLYKAGDVKALSKKASAKKKITINNNPENDQTIFISNLKEFEEELREEETRQKVQSYVESGLADAVASQAHSPQQIYHLPSVDLLEDIPKKGLDINQDEIDSNAKILVDTLANFGVNGSINTVSVGPTITEYEFQPAAGVKVSKILNLSDDLALNLATTGIRIQAPIPGKPAVGIEVPNKRARVVRIKELIAGQAFQAAESPLSVVLGKDISGQSIITDLSKMPHLLIAGSTGSGKSVCLNALIMSLLYKAKPYEVKLLMIDPKMVELGNYNGIPHLLAPVVTDPKKAAATLRWAVKEMESRYEKFAASGAKDIRRYNEKCLERQAKGEFSPETETLPNIVIIIDELADLMMVAPADVEDAICRLAQMARAAGMHLVIATQRPSVDVITGIIKANIPSRIAFAVSSQVDSRTILDMGGAEKLLGRGDMLFYPTGMAKPKRVQGVFVTDDEIDAVVDAVKAEAKPDYNEDVMAAENIAADTKNQTDSDEAAYDDLIGEACRLFIENGQASISMLQRHFRIGYTRAARIIDQLEELGYVGPYEGSKPRQIKMTMEEYDRQFGNQQK